MQHKTYKKVALVILDGFGVASYNHGNAIAVANPATLNYMVSQFPSITLQASGPLVGLPWGEMGNSEVGHLNIGAGRIVGQDLPRITDAISTGDFFKNPVLLEAVNHAIKNKSRLHLMGMISPGGVHSLDQHLYALLGLAQKHGLQEVYIHMFTDGRDTDEKIAIESVRKLKEKITEIGVGQIATITGRFYAMDRGKHWDQTEMTFQALVNGEGQSCISAEQCILDNYSQNIFDEMIPPSVIVQVDPVTKEKLPVAKISSNDSVIFFNFRSDRALQLTQAFVRPEVMDINNKHSPLDNLYFVTMTEYFFGLPVNVVFPSHNLDNNLAEVISVSGLSQYHIAESEKYAHVTSFFNGGLSQPLKGEERYIVTSPSNSKNYSDKPEMSAPELSASLIDKILHSDHSLFVANFANPDMVGHTGNFESAVKAVHCIDMLLQQIMEAVLQVDAALIITADHGNIEQMINPHTGQIDKDHSTSPVPFILIANQFRYEKSLQRDYVSLSAHVPAGIISDIAPTIISLLGLSKPVEMTGLNLLESLDAPSVIFQTPLPQAP